MSKIRILGIAPYEGISILMNQIAGRKPEIELEAFTGNLEAGCALVRQRGADFDCIISRGGTAQMIRRITTKPVVEIEFSAYDLLQSINLAKSYSDKWAVVGFDPITKNAKLISDLLQYNLDIFTLNNESAADSVLNHLKENGYQMVVCDTITDIAAKRQGIDSILIHSGLESVESAIAEAIHICEAYSGLKAQKELFETLLDNLGVGFFAYDSKNECVYSNHRTENGEEVAAIISSQLMLSPAERSTLIQKNIKGSVYTIEAESVEYHGETYTIFNVFCQKNKTAKKPTGIQYYSAKELNDKFLRHFYISHNSDLTKYERIDGATQAPPLMILGAPGTGKAQYAAYLHIKSTNWNTPFIDCDFSIMSDKELQYLFSSIQSPIWSNQVTIYMHGIDALSDEQFDNLSALMHDSHLCSRNRVVFSWVRAPHGDVPPRARVLMDSFTCYTVTLPTLCERVHDIPQLAAKYINSFNSSLPHQVVGFRPEALVLLEKYNWPGNLSQLKRIVFQAMTQTDEAYISADTVSAIIENEKAHLLPEAELALDISGTLDEIKQEVVKIVLAQCGNNQSKAAERLGIGRTTLWRILGR